MNHRFSLDRTARKFLCPKCDKKRFVRYRDLQTNEYLPEIVGRCDREINCSYHCTPKQLFHERPILKMNYQEPSNGLLLKPNKPIVITPDFIVPNLVIESMKGYETNNFIRFLTQLFGKTVSRNLAQQFRLGTSRKWNKQSVVFWQIDTYLQVRSGKVMLYNENTGNRVKASGKACIDWVHSILLRNNQLKDFKLSQCLFGLHQINKEKEKVIAVVESEKTAILMTAVMPKFVWLACGSASNLKLELFTDLIDRQIILFPDLGCYEKWVDKSYDLKKVNPNIHVSDLLEKKATEEDKTKGLDLADFLIKRCVKTRFALTNDNYPLFWDL